MATTETLYTITIPRWLPPTANQLMRGKLRDRIKLGKAARQMVGWYWWESKHRLATGKRRVGLRVTAGPGRRFGDADAYWKSVLDALTACGAIRTDSHLWVELSPVEFVRGTEDETQITLEEL